MEGEIDRTRFAGFTLIELSIVLVIIGLIVGGLLVGQDLIKAAQVRSTITQVERFNTAVNTFRGKYNALPGDLNQSVATQFGFGARGSYTGEGDGDGVILGVTANAPSSVIETSEAGETAMFWVDLTYANGMNVNLIPGSFSSASSTSGPGNITSSSSPNLDAFLPAAKLGNGNYFYVWGINGTNYFGLSNVAILGTGLQSTPGLTVQQAYQIDKKVDDGLPQLGNVIALYISNNGSNFLWANGTDSAGAPYATATAGSSLSCFDNSSSSGATQQYSIKQNNGNGVNCALSFRFQ